MLTLHRTLITILLFALTPGAAPAQDACGRDGPSCETATGTYRIAIPEGTAPEGGWPAVAFFHGAGGSGARTLGSNGMVGAALARGYAVIAPDGLQRPASRFGPGWSFHPDRPKQRDEVAFTREFLADAAERFSLNEGQMMLSGFSIGGSLVWYLACQAPDLAVAYAPVGGAFWRPHPAMDACVAPVRMLHTHGWRDRVVPLEGRPLGGGRIYQGDVFYSLQILRAVNGCEGMRADAFDTDGTTWRRTWEACTPGSALTFDLHSGGHAVPDGWADRALDWLEALPQDS